MISMMASLRPGRSIAAVTAVVLLAGCGSGHKSRQGSSASAGAGRSQAAAVEVIRAWSSALRRGDVRGAARYFALPSVFANGSGQVPVIIIHTEREAQVINESLPCGALFISAVKSGRYVKALFRLTDRPGPGGGCGAGIGQLASTDFVVRGGRIAQWIRAPDNSGGGAPPSPSSPPSQQHTGPLV
jgi:hypothetical protein